MAETITTLNDAELDSVTGGWYYPTVTKTATGGSFNFTVLSGNASGNQVATLFSSNNSANGNGGGNASA